MPYKLTTVDGKEHDLAEEDTSIEIVIRGNAASPGWVKVKQASGVAYVQLAHVVKVAQWESSKAVPTGVPRSG